MKLGFYGGSFNPPHEGHQYIIEYCNKEFDKFLVIPNNNSPDLNKDILAPFQHRYNMLKLQLRKKNVEIDEFEINSNQTNFTYLTIQYLMKKYNEYEIFMVLGQDQLSNLHNWYKIDFILKHTQIICFERKTKLKNLNIPFNVKLINFDFPFSSSYIRERIQMNKSIDSNIINKQVLNYIKENKLYI